MNSYLERYLPVNAAKYLRYAINVFILVLFAGNLIASLFRVGFRPF